MGNDLHQNGEGESQPTFITCPQCGNLCNTEKSNCAGCGEPLRNAVRQPTESQTTDNRFNQQNNKYESRYPSYQTSYSLKDVYQNDEDAYIQTKTDYYKTKFAELNKSNSKVSWNLYAFIITPVWFVYRKMYAFGFGFIAIQYILLFAAYVLDVKYQTQYYTLFSLIILIIIWLALSLMGNYIYKSRINRLIIEGQKLDEPFKSRHIQKNGGVSLAALIISIAALIVLFITVINPLANL